ncbi:DUF2461 domain-containing protein [soil metagenome]
MPEQSILKFLKDLSKNNNRPWFEEHRNQYEKAKADLNIFLTGLIKQIGAFDKPIGLLEAKDCMFRINRDVRFSKDKKPYKNNMAGYFNKAGKKGIGAGYYLHLQPGESFAAGGIWMPEPLVLSKIRQEIDYNFDEWKKMVSASSFKKNFPGGLENSDRLSRPPKGYEADNLAIEYLKLKNFIVSRSFTDAEIISKGFEAEVAKTFKAMKPMIDFFNRAID